ncbi:MAG: sugar kinase [Pseudomonadota bacterium]
MIRTGVACLGEVMVEVALGRTLPGPGQIGFAGDTYNTAVYLKRMAPELRVAFGTRLGQDPLSDAVLAQMEREEIDPELVARDAGTLPGLYAVRTDTRGERSFMYWRRNSPARGIFQNAEALFHKLAPFAMVYFSAITLAIVPAAHRTAFFDAAARYRDAGGQIAFDSNYRPALWDDVETARDAVSRAWALADVALPSLDDEMALFGDADAAAVLHRIGAGRPASGALKRGAEGPLDLTGKICSDAPPATRVVDTTAAGDSFNAGFIAAYMRGETTDLCMQSGHRLAAEVIAHPGAIMPMKGTPQT